jgi:hypothetical protein
MTLRLVFRIVIKAARFYAAEELSKLCNKIRDAPEDQLAMTEQTEKTEKVSRSEKWRDRMKKYLPM